MPRMTRRAGRRAARRTVRRRAPMRRRARRVRRRRMLVGGAIVVGTGAMAYKLGKSQTQQIEQAAGKSIDEMSDEEIQQYVEAHNIPVEPLDEADQAAMSDADAEYEDEPDYTQELQKLADLHDQGILTDEEFEAKKKQILGI